MLEIVLAWDVGLRSWLTTHHHPLLDALFIAAAVAGISGAIWLLIGVALTLRHRPLAGGLFQLALGILLLQLTIDGLIKPLVGRHRPFVSDAAVRLVGYEPTTYSFPSGHAASSVAGAFILARMRRRWTRAFWSLAVLIALSRVYLGVHYPADVAAGAVIGYAMAYWVTGNADWNPTPDGST